MKKKLLLSALLLTVVITAAAGLYLFVFLRVVRVPTAAMANTIMPGDNLFVQRPPREIRRGDILIFRAPHEPSVEFVKRVIGLPGEKIQILDTQIFINDQRLPEQQHWVSASMTETGYELTPIPDRPPVIPAETDYQPFSTNGPAKKYKVYYQLRNTGWPAAPDEMTGEKTEHLSAITKQIQPVPCLYQAQALQANPGTKEFGGRPLFGVTEPCLIQPGQYFMLGDNRNDSHDSRYYGTVGRELITGQPTRVYYSAPRDEAGTEHIRWDRFWLKLE